jgi:hypothetical protein
MPDLLASYVYNSIADANEPREYNEWHASSVAECPRAQYFKRLGVPPVTQPTAAKMIRWQAGHSLEEVVRSHLAKHYPDLKSNVRMTSKKWDLTGEYDNYSEKAKLLVEVKSVSGYAMKKRYADEDRFHLRDSQPYLNHIYQNHAYVLLLREKKLPVERITFLYITLDGLLCSYTINVREGVLEAVRKRLVILKQAMTAQTAPDCMCGNLDHPLYHCQMRWCDYKTKDGCCDVNLLKEVKS